MYSSPVNHASTRHKYDPAFKQGGIVTITGGMHKGSNAILVCGSGGPSYENPQWKVTKVLPNGEFTTLYIVQSRLRLVATDQTPPTPAPVQQLRPSADFFARQLFVDPSPALPIPPFPMVPRVPEKVVEETAEESQEVAKVVDEIAEEDAREVAEAADTIAKMFSALSVNDRAQLLKSLHTVHESLDVPHGQSIDEVPAFGKPKPALPPIPINQVSGEKGDSV